MPQKLVIQCNYSGNEKISYNWGSLFHGALMELLPGETAGTLHEQSLRPFSQYIIPVAENKLEWHIGLLDSVISEDIIKTIMPLSQIVLKQKDTTLEITSSSRKKESGRDFFDRFFSSEQPCRRYEMEFITPCTHKSAGEYVLFPSAAHIIQNLYMHFASFSEEFSIDDPETMEQIIKNIHIVRYSLRSSKYHLDGIKVNGYTGRVTLLLQGPDQLARLTGMLLSFAEYAGVGIKTSLGMGGCLVKQLAANI